VTGSSHREPVDNLVQLFNLGTVNLFGLPGFFVIRFFPAKPNQQIVFVLWSQPPHRRNTNSIVSKATIDDQVTEIAADSTGSRMKSNGPARPQIHRSSAQQNMVLSAGPGGDNQIGVVQYFVVSNTRLRYAIRTGGLIRVGPAS